MCAEGKALSVRQQPGDAAAGAASDCQDVTNQAVVRSDCRSAAQPGLHERGDIASSLMLGTKSSHAGWVTALRV